ncbi:MAG TPA: phosphatase PAP2 family protein [Burkholderiales bacterium]|nr:phosphatase PAP2 family protein [Burkholderiales bacterium]
MHRARRVAITVALLSWAGFGMVLYQVIAHGPLTAIDPPAIAWAASHRNGAWTAAAEWISRTGGPSMTSVYAGIFMLVALARRRFATATAVALVIYGGIVLNVIVKNSVQRGRPIMEDPLVHLITYSFPSGHAAASTVFGGFLIALVATRCANARTRVLAIALIASWIAAVCAGRVYLGAHYPTDVAGGLLEGTGWLLLCGFVAQRYGLLRADRLRAR